MDGGTVLVELAQDPRYAKDLSAGGVFVPVEGLELNQHCELTVRGLRGDELMLPARVVYVAPTGGAGLEVLGFSPAIKERLAELAIPPEPPPAPEPAAEAAQEGDTEGEDGDEVGDDGKPKKKFALNIMERLRGLTLAQQVRAANSSDPTTRITLERLYGKNVWEALLRNNRLTAPEVARMARMGTMPRVQLETIVNNGAWLQIPEVRRALLTNPRLGTDQILRVLRMMPKHELKVVSTMSAYTYAVRDAAKRLMLDAER